MINDSSVVAELLVSLPPDASYNQENLPEGFYRTVAGKKKKIISQRSRNRVSVKFLKAIENYVQVGHSTKMYPAGTDLILKVDQFKDEATCPKCDGKGYSDDVCIDCGGSKVWYVDSQGVRDKRALADRTSMNQVACKTCMASEYGMPIPRSTGYQPCLPCKGTGQRGVGSSLIATTTSRQDEPTTGVILATGSQVTKWERGDRVLFSRYAGDAFEYERREFRIMDERYPRAKLVGNDDLRVTAAQE